VWTRLSRPEDAGCMFFWNLNSYLPYGVETKRRLSTDQQLPWKPENLQRDALFIKLSSLSKLSVKKIFINNLLMFSNLLGCQRFWFQCLWDAMD
jgi:hypothetical protein